MLNVEKALDDMWLAYVAFIEIGDELLKVVIAAVHGSTELSLVSLIASGVQKYVAIVIVYF